jgi:hypothetical protein
MKALFMSVLAIGLMVSSSGFARTEAAKAPTKKVAVKSKGPLHYQRSASNKSINPVVKKNCNKRPHTLLTSREGAYTRDMKNRQQQQQRQAPATTVRGSSTT